MEEKEMKELLIWEIKYASSLSQLRYVHSIIAKMHSDRKISTELLIEIDKYRKAKGEILKSSLSKEGLQKYLSKLTTK